MRVSYAPAMIANRTVTEISAGPAGNAVPSSLLRERIMTTSQHHNRIAALLQNQPATKATTGTTELSASLPMDVMETLGLRPALLLADLLLTGNRRSGLDEQLGAIVLGAKRKPRDEDEEEEEKKKEKGKTDSDETDEEKTDEDEEVAFDDDEEEELDEEEEEFEEDDEEDEEDDDEFDSPDDDEEEEEEDEDDEEEEEEEDEDDDYDDDDEDDDSDEDFE